MSAKTTRLWLSENKEKFGTQDGLPGAFHRESLYSLIRAGKTVSIVTPQGMISTGRAVMRGPAGWVLNMGGRYGTPGIASDENTIYVAGAKLPKPSKKSAFNSGDLANAMVGGNRIPQRGAI